MKKHYYASFTPQGKFIDPTWEICQKRVNKTKSKYKSFPTQQLAEAYLDTFPDIGEKSYYYLKQNPPPNLFSNKENIQPNIDSGKVIYHVGKTRSSSQETPFLSHQPIKTKKRKLNASSHLSIDNTFKTTFDTFSQTDIQGNLHLQLIFQPYPTSTAINTPCHPSSTSTFQPLLSPCTVISETYSCSDLDTDALEQIDKTIIASELASSRNAEMKTDIAEETDYDEIPNTPPFNISTPKAQEPKSFYSRIEDIISTMTSPNVPKTDAIAPFTAPDFIPFSPVPEPKEIHYDQVMSHPVEWSIYCYVNATPSIKSVKANTNTHSLSISYSTKSIRGTTKDYSGTQNSADIECILLGLRGVLDAIEIAKASSEFILGDANYNQQQQQWQANQTTIYFKIQSNYINWMYPKYFNQWQVNNYRDGAIADKEKWEEFRKLKEGFKGVHVGRV